jgi:hypothetical protein
MPHPVALHVHEDLTVMPLGSRGEKSLQSPALWAGIQQHVCHAGTSYLDFINRMHLPSQLAQVDPIVASFCGGAVGVLSALMIVEINNAKTQEKRRCQYCEVS